jgi:hypothetical protein
LKGGIRGELGEFRDSGVGCGLGGVRLGMCGLEYNYEYWSLKEELNSGVICKVACKV